jgi:membrane-associated HD superfamily phosphohydrolase
MNNKFSGSKTNRRKNVIISLIVVLAVAFCFFIYSRLTTHPNNSKLSVSFVYIIMRYVLLALAPVVFLLHLVRIIKSGHLLFIVTAIGNMAIGITAVLLYLIDKADLQWLHQCLINLLVGFLLLIVVYLPFKQAR